ETITTDLANYRGTDNEQYNWSGSYGSGPKGDYREETTPVNHFDIANAFGLCDMHGNVWEWCQDHWHDNNKGAPTDGSAWLTDNEDANRVLRGGSWLNIPEYCRSARRYLVTPVYRDSTLGFRVVSAPPRSLP
ncbi:MAG: formylglycine-generating enzyme family protein, partial [Cyanobacteria bacterium J06636_28]